MIPSSANTTWQQLFSCGGLHELLLHTLAYWLTQSYSGLMHVTTAAVSSMSQHSSSFSGSHAFFPQCLFWNVLRALKGLKEVSHFWMGHLFSALWLSMSLCINHCSLKKEVSLTKTESSNKLWSKTNIQRTLDNMFTWQNSSNRGLWPPQPWIFDWVNSMNSLLWKGPQIQPEDNWLAS